MQRIIFTGRFPSAPANKQNYLVITPHRPSAEAIGSVHNSLRRLAVDAVRLQGLEIASGAVSRRILKKAIREAGAPGDASSYAVRIGQILKTALRTGIDLEMLAEHGSARVARFATVTLRYKEKLRAESLIDAEELLWTAAGCGPAQRRLLIYGHHRARKEEIHFINAVAGDGSIYYLPCSDDPIFDANRQWADWLAGRGWTIDAAEAGPTAAGETIAARFAGEASRQASSYIEPPISYPTIEAEVRAVLGAAKQLVLDGCYAGDIALVCRDKDLYAPVISAAAEEYGIPIRLIHEIPITRTSLGSLLQLVLDSASSGFPFENTARLLNHPLGPGIPDGSWPAARARGISGAEQWEEIGADLGCLKWPGVQSLRKWAECLKSALTAFNVRTKAAHSARDVIALERFLNCIDQAVELEGDTELDLEAFTGVINEICSEETVPFQPSSAGIPFFEPNTILGAAFDHVFILGLAEGIFPAPVTDNPVIDFFERRSLLQHGIDFEEAAEVARWESLSFYLTLLTARCSVRLSCPASIDNAERLASSFFDRLGVRPVKAGTAYSLVSSMEEKCAAQLRRKPADEEFINAAYRKYKLELYRESLSPHDEFDGVIGVSLDPASHRWSVSQLTRFGKCRFSWFAEKLLGLKAAVEAEFGMDYTRRGSFYHKVLEIAVRAARDAVDIRAATLANLESAFAQAEADDSIGMASMTNWGLQRADHLRTLRRAILSPDFISDGARVIGLEERFEAEWQGFSMIGYIDRIDRTSAGVVAIDYKTSSSAPKGAKDESGKLKIDVQIPIYSNVALKNLFPEEHLGESIYYSLTKGKVLKRSKGDGLENVERLAERIRDDMAKGNFAPDPDVNEYSCEYCDHDPICRKGPRLHRKSASNEVKS